MLAERLLRAVRGIRVYYEGKEISVTVSIGIAEMNPQYDWSDWLRQADSALYRAKQGGRDRLAL